MKRSKILVPLVGGVAVAIALSGCASSSESSDAASTPAATSAEADPAGESGEEASDAETSGESDADTAQAEPAGPSEDMAASLAMLYSAVQGFQERTAEAGGSSFTLSDVSGSNNSVFRQNTDGKGERESTYDTGATEMYFWDGEQHWTQVAYLNDEMKELAREVDPNAKFYLEPTGTFMIPASPDRVLLTLLAYTTDAACTPNTDGSQECTLTVEGLSALPGLGGFDTPAENNEATVTLSSDGTIMSMTLFPGNKDLERRLTDITFAANNITLPTENETVTLDELSRQAILNDEARQQEEQANQPQTSDPATSDAITPAP